jgi:hypothetical protein
VKPRKLRQLLLELDTDAETVANLVAERRKLTFIPFVRGEQQE